MEKPVLVFFGHHKCATQYINKILLSIARRKGLSAQVARFPDKLPFEYELREPFKSQIQAERDDIRFGDYDILLHANAGRALLEDLAARGYCGFHLIRDPRDIIISGYFSHLHSHPVERDFNPWLLEHRAKLESCNQEEGLLLEIEYASTYLERITNWDYGNPNIYETRYETLVENPQLEFNNILSHFHLSVEDDFLSGAIQENAFEKLSGGRERGAEDQKNHYRSGIPGDWKQHFSPRIKQTFLKRYGSMLTMLGYEQSNDW